MGWMLRESNSVYGGDAPYYNYGGTYKVSSGEYQDKINVDLIVQNSQNGSTVMAQFTTVMQTGKNYRVVVKLNHMGTTHTIQNREFTYGGSLSGEVTIVNDQINGFSVAKIDDLYTAYFYEYVNTAPTTPGLFTSPTTSTELKKNTTTTVSWGASSDAEGGTITYVLEASYNGGSTYSTIATTTATSYSHLLPDQSQVRYRVRARDTNNAYSAYRTSDNFSINQNTPPTTPGAFTSPSGTLEGKSTSVLVDWGNSSDVEGNLSNYVLEYSLNGGAYTIHSSPTVSQATVNIDPITSPTHTSIRFRARGKDTEDLYSDYVYSDTFTVVHNAIPALLLNTADNQTFYENDTFKIDGQATDTDNGNVVTTRYRIEGHTSNRAIATKISDGTTPIPFSKELTFREGNLYDGNTIIVEGLQASTTYTLKVFAEDDQGAQSEIETRAFNVVPNRAPALTIDSFSQLEDQINTDTFTISGTANDPDDGNTVKVSYRLNGDNAIEIYSGSPGAWTFDLNVGNLTDGENTIAIEAVDTYDYQSSKTLKLNKTLGKAPLLESVVRYKIEPPTGSAKGVLLWIQREENLNIEAAISMTNSGEAESYQVMTLTNNVPINTGIVEDEFESEVVDPKENIVIKLGLTRPDATTSDSILLITGVLD